MKIEVQDFIKQLFIEHRNAKSISGIGLVLLSLVYSLDNWFHINRSRFFDRNYSYLLFYLGIGLFLTGLFVMLLGTTWSWVKIVYYRCKYPFKRLNSSFYTISFQGRVCLIDVVRKEIKWIKTWQTAIDLDFIGEWTNVDVNVTQPLTLIKTKLVTKDGKKLSLKDFKYVSGIHTQGIPGT